MGDIGTDGPLSISKRQLHLYLYLGSAIFLFGCTEYAMHQIGYIQGHADGFNECRASQINALDRIIGPPQNHTRTLYVPEPLYYNIDDPATIYTGSPPDDLRRVAIESNH